MYVNAPKRTRAREQGVALILVVILMVVTVVLGGVLIAVPHAGLKREAEAEVKEQSYLAADAGVGEALVKIISGAITPPASAPALRVPSTGTTSFGKNGGAYWYEVILTGTNVQVSSHGVMTDLTVTGASKVVETEVEVLLKYPAPDPPGISGMVSDGFAPANGSARYGIVGKGELTGLNLDMGWSGDTTGSPTTDLYGLAQSSGEPSQGWWLPATAVGWPDWGLTGKDASSSQVNGSLGSNTNPAHPLAPTAGSPRNSPCSAFQGALPAPTTGFYTTGGANSIRDMPNGDASVSQPAGTFNVSSLSPADRGNPNTYKLRIVRPTALPANSTDPVVRIDADFYGVIAVDFSKNGTLNIATSFPNTIFRTEGGAQMNGICFMNTGVGDTSGGTWTNFFSKPIFSQLGPPHAVLDGTVDVTTSTTLVGNGTSFSATGQGAIGSILTFPTVTGSYRVTGVTDATHLTLDAAPGSAATDVKASAAASLSGSGVSSSGTTITGGSGSQFTLEAPVGSTLRFGTNANTFTVATVTSDTALTVTVAPSSALPSGTAVNRVTPSTGGPLKGCVIYSWHCDLGPQYLCLGDTATHRPGNAWPHNAPPHTTMGPGMQYRLGIVAAAMGAFADRSRLIIASYRVVR